MSMVRLIYMSHFDSTVNPNDMQNILETSRQNNKNWGITGVLCYAPHCFLQCLEGPRDHVNGLYNQIIGDERHENVTLLQYAEIDERNFTKWSMAFIRIDESTEPIILKYSKSKLFDPFSMTALQAQGFIAEIAHDHEAYLANQMARLFPKPENHSDPVVVE